MYIKYRINARVLAKQFTDLLISSGLSDNRPIQDPQCIEGMLKHSDLTASAWAGGRLIGMARAVTDFHYVCHISELAVAHGYQGKGVGTRLQALIQQQLGERCQLVLLSPPETNAYYPKLGFEPNQRCWTLPRNRRLSRVLNKVSA